MIDTAPADQPTSGIFLGDLDKAYGRNLPGSLKNITLSNVIYNSTEVPIRANGYLWDSAITNVISTQSVSPVIAVARADGLQNVKIDNIIAPEGVAVVQQI